MRSRLVTTVRQPIGTAFAGPAASLGFSGGARTITNGHNSACAYIARRQADVWRILVSNVAVWGNSTDGEVATADDITVSVQVETPTHATGFTVTFDAPLSAGATSGTLLANWGQATQNYQVRLSSGELRQVALTNGAKTATWSKALVSAATASAVTVETAIKTVKFSGSTTVTLKGGQRSYAWSDPIEAKLLPADPFWVKSFVIKSGGGSFSLPGNYAANHQDALTLGVFEGFFDSSSDISGTKMGRSGWTVPAGASSIYRPIHLQALWPLGGRTPEGLVVPGDSIVSSYAAWLPTFLHANGVPFANLAKAGEGQGDWPAEGTIRALALNGHKIAICTMGANSTSFSALQRLWLQLRDAGIRKIIQTTITPRTTGDGATVAGQTDDATTPPLNASIVGALGSYIGPDVIWDARAAVDATASGFPNRWAAGRSIDLLHPSTTGIADILSYAATHSWAADLV